MPQLFAIENSMAQTDFENGVFIATFILMRGEDVNISAVINAISKIKETLRFSQFVMTGVKTGICNEPLVGFNLSGTNLVNHTGISQIFKRIIKQFDILFERQAFLHWYTDEGMSEIDLKSARDNVYQLVTEYEENLD